MVYHAGASCCHLSASHGAPCCANEPHIRQLLRQIQRCRQRVWVMMMQMFPFCQLQLPRNELLYCVVLYCVALIHSNEYDLILTIQTAPTCSRSIRFLKSSKLSPLSPVFFHQAKAKEFTSFISIILETWAQPGCATTW